MDFTGVTENRAPVGTEKNATSRESLTRSSGGVVEQPPRDELRAVSERELLRRGVHLGAHGGQVGGELLESPPDGGAAGQELPLGLGLQPVADDGDGLLRLATVDGDVLARYVGDEPLVPELL